MKHWQTRLHSPLQPAQDQSWLQSLSQINTCVRRHPLINQELHHAGEENSNECTHHLPCNQLSSPNILLLIQGSFAGLVLPRACSYIAKKHNALHVLRPSFPTPASGSLLNWSSCGPPWSLPAQGISGEWGC